MNALESHVRTLLARQLEGSAAAGAVVDIQAPLHGISLTLAEGRIAHADSAPLNPRHGFRVASISKTITATLVMQRIESGELALDRTLPGLLPAAIVQRLPHGRHITIGQLLNHTAGLWDFAMSASWHKALLADPGRVRVPAEILEFALANAPAAGPPPPAAWCYSDTGYVLLGHVLEHLTGLDWHVLCRREVLDRLRLDHTWMEVHEAPRAPLSHPYRGDLDGLLINGSADWAAGGHVSTAPDLARLARGLCEGELFRRPDTLTAMLRGVPAEGYGVYACGLMRRRLAGRALWGHTGFWGAFMYYLPAWRATLTGTLNHVDADRDTLLVSLIQLIDRSASTTVTT